ncbi:phage major capsid protein [Streptomyces paludis]|uniref:Phage major capsid protein n=1 Tax=Streptomyces paludis TaxID=2282738 RepID=A0A345HUS8_9ACTN|nr:phage major capsid protein [Streptomyces paludis]AXG80452.1 phage major capsid protein [Streptomyces paludis]
MSINTYTPGVQGILPDEYGALVEKPVKELSLAMKLGTVINTSSNVYRIPMLVDDVTVGAVAEGAEITPSDAKFDENQVKPAKFAGLTIISREMAEDSSPSAGEQVGRSIARQISKSVDNALLNALSDPNPAGLGSLKGISKVAAPVVYANLDPFEEAISLSESAGGNITAWVMSATTALEIAKLKDETNSNRSLLNTDMTMEGRRQILGRPVYVSPFAQPDIVYGISREEILTIVRTDTRLDVDKSVFFTSDRVAVKGTMRVAFGFPVEGAHVRIQNASE